MNDAITTKNGKNYKYITYADRAKIARLYAADMPVLEIAAIIKANKTTIYRELERGNTGQLNVNLKPEYSAEVAQRRAVENLKQRAQKTQGDKKRLTKRF